MKIYPFRIPKGLHENIIVQIDQSDKFYDRLHQHEEIQLSYVISGRGKLLVGNGISTFEPGDFVAIGSNVPHLFQSDSKSEKSYMTSLFFLIESFGEDFFKNEEMQILSPLFESIERSFKLKRSDDFLQKAFTKFEKQDKLSLFIGLLELLRHLLDKEKIILSDALSPTKLSGGQGERLQVVFDYAMKSFQSDIILEDVANQIHMSKNAFCRFFKQHTNKTFFQFLTEIRIQHACGLLAESPEMPIAEAAALSGFNSISNFNRQFKRQKLMNARQFRKQFSLRK